MPPSTAGHPVSRSALLRLMVAAAVLAMAISTGTQVGAQGTWSCTLDSIGCWGGGCRMGITIPGIGDGTTYSIRNYYCYDWAFDYSWYQAVIDGCCYFAW